MSEPFDRLDELPARPHQVIPAADRDLLELAGSALGAVLVEDVDGENWVNLHFEDGTVTYGWNPLLFNGDTFELVVRLRLFEDMQNFLSNLSEEQHQTLDQIAAARRAAVRAAAEVAEQR